MNNRVYVVCGLIAGAAVKMVTSSKEEAVAECVALMPQSHGFFTGDCRRQNYYAGEGNDLDLWNLSEREFRWKQSNSDSFPKFEYF